jgi:hypothetical protein
MNRGLREHLPPGRACTELTLPGAGDGDRDDAGRGI